MGVRPPRMGFMLFLPRQSSYALRTSRPGKTGSPVPPLKGASSPLSQGPAGRARELSVGVISWRKLAGQSRPQLGRTGWNAIRGVLLAPLGSAAQRHYTHDHGGGLGSAGGRRRLWPPRRGCQCARSAPPSFGRSGPSSWCAASSSCWRVGKRTLVPYSCLLRHVYSRATAETVGSFITAKEVIASHDLQRSGMVRACPWRTPRALDRDECRRLLGSTNVGRLGYCTDFGPRIVLMNYTMVSEAVTFRTGIDTEASHRLIIRLRSRLIKSTSSSDRMERSRHRKRPAPRQKSLLLLDVGQKPQPWPPGRQRWSCNCHLRS